MRCDTCKYYEDDNRVIGTYDGFCKRYPPQITFIEDRLDINNRIDGIWPLVFITDWCGEYANRNTV